MAEVLRNYLQSKGVTTVPVTIINGSSGREGGIDFPAGIFDIQSYVTGVRFTGYIPSRMDPNAPQYAGYSPATSVNLWLVSGRDGHKYKIGQSITIRSPEDMMHALTTLIPVKVTQSRAPAIVEDPNSIHGQTRAPATDEDPTSIQGKLDIIIDLLRQMKA